MKKPHLFWILIDSARNYQTDEDDRGLPQAVLDFAKESVYFKNVITSAPSTVQSISSMMTSSPSYLLSRSYNNYRGKLDCFDYFPEMLRDNGYQTFGAIYFKHGREVMSEMFGHIGKRYLPKDLSHRKEVWTNRDVFNLFSNIIDKHDWSQPTMSYLHYNVRVDSDVSLVLDDTIDKIKEKGLFDSSVILVNSDHGYPDPDKNYNFEEGLKQGWGHDKYMTNDNILTPLVIHYPDVKPRVIETYVATIDIVPTLCDLLCVNKSEKFHGANILGDLEDQKKRLIRTDNRYIGQLPSYNSYIQGKKKAIVFKDHDQEDQYTFFDLNRDPKEMHGESQIGQYAKFYQDVLAHENGLNNFHQNFLVSNWRGALERLKNRKPNSVCVTLKSSTAFKQIVLNALNEVFRPETIQYYNEVGNDQKEFDLNIYIIESEIPWDLSSLKKLGVNILAKENIFIDNNGRVFRSNVQIKLYVNFIAKRWLILKHDKLFIFDLMKRMLKRKVLKPIK